MKTKLTILLCALAGTVHANLIDLTPGGFDFTQPYPKEFLNFVHREVDNRITFFDAAHPNGWDSLYGALNGGTYFFTNLIGNPGPTANVSWDFTTLPGWSMSVLLIEGEMWGHLYGVGGRFDTVDLGDLVTLHDGLNITSLAFYGRNPDSASVPDSGSTLALMGIALVGFFFLQRKSLSGVSTEPLPRVVWCAP
jgi:hypothetical protein